MTPFDMILLGLLWLAYFSLHSLFASLWLKRHVAGRWPGLMPWYRLLFNALAMILLLPPVALAWWLGGEPVWRFEGIWNWFRLGLMGLALAGFAWSLRYYDGQAFIGLRQIAAGQRDIADQERLHISPLHRYVRHPWYSLGLVLIWTQELDPARLFSALLISAYLFIGSIQEEHKLTLYHGERYRRYKARVPGLIPLPGHHLTKAEAKALLE
jgi:methanethiol S-methyltransferase